MKSHIHLSFDDAIADVRRFKEHIFFLDSKLNLHKYSKEFVEQNSYKLFQEAVQYENQRLLKNGSILFEKEGKLHTYTVKSKLTKEIHWLKEDFTSIAESVDGKYIAVGYQDGSVTIFFVNGLVYQSINLTFGAIKSIFFSEFNNKLIINCERHKTVIHDVDYDKTISTILTKAIITHATFMDEERIFAISDGGFTWILNVTKESVEDSHDNEITGVTALSISLDKEYGIVGSYDGVLTVIFIERNKILFSKKLSSSEVTLIKWIDNTLVVIYENNEVDVFILGEVHSRVKEFIEIKDFESTSELLESNVFLSLFSDIEKELDKVWNEDVFPNALNLILDGEITEATEIVKPFIHDVYKKKVFNIYIDKPEVPKKFQLSFDNKDYVSFFELAKQYPHLKKTNIYQLANKEWEIAYEKALLAMKKELKDKAIQILKPFYEVTSKKHIISTLVNIPKMFIDSQKEFNGKRYDEYFSIVARAPVLKETPEYQQVTSQAKKILDKIKLAKQQNNLKDQIMLSKKLSDFKPYRKQADKFLEEIKDKIHFLDYLSKDELRLSYDIAERYHDITTLKEFKELYEHYRQKEVLTYKYLKKGNVKEILRILHSFTSVAFLKNKIAGLIKIAYVNSLTYAKDTHILDWKATSENYGRLFGLDRDIELMIKNLGYEKEFYKASGARSNKGYIKAELPQTIIQYKTEKQLEKEELKIKEQKKGKYSYLVHLIVTVFIILSVIFIANFMGDFLSTEINNYNQSRKAGPYQFFNRAQEEYQKQGGNPEEDAQKKNSFLDSVR